MMGLAGTRQLVLVLTGVALTCVAAPAGVALFWWAACHALRRFRPGATEWHPALLRPALSGSAISDPRLQARSNQTGLAPFVPHLAYLPLASRQRLDFAGALFVHFVKCPLASRHGAASAGADPVIKPTADNAMTNLRIS